MQNVIRLTSRHREYLQEARLWRGFFFIRERAWRYSFPAAHFRSQAKLCLHHHQQEAVQIEDDEAMACKVSSSLSDTWGTQSQQRC
eukprot:c21674_g1_i2 orf=162-419(-)